MTKSNNNMDELTNQKARIRAKMKHGDQRSAARVAGVTPSEIHRWLGYGRTCKNDERFLNAFAEVFRSREKKNVEISKIEL